MKFAELRKDSVARRFPPLPRDWRDLHAVSLAARNWPPTLVAQPAMVP